jgi:hypothetical protein
MMSAAVLAATLAVSAQPVFADVSRSVISAFRGQLVITKDELPEGKNDKDTISKIKAAQLKTLEGSPRGDVTGWDFHYTAFLTKSGATHLKVNFLNGKQLSADKQLDGVDPKSTVLSGDITIDEDEGLAKGKTYTIEVLNGTSVVAKTTLTMK